MNPPTHPAPPGNVRRLPLDGMAGAVARGRDFTRTALSDWGWLPAVGGERQMAAEDLLLLVSELIANACLHAGGPKELVLRRTKAGLRVEVSDGSALLPALQDGRSPSTPSGHGLRVVDKLSTTWGSVPTAAGKTVWLQIELP